MTTKSKGRALILDGCNYLFRAHHSMPVSADRSGRPNNAINGFLSILCTDIKVLTPKYLAVVFDGPRGSSWRRDLLPQYKGNRDSESKDLVYSQLIPVRDILRSLGLVVIIKAGCEADDTMGSLAVRFASQGVHALVSTNDKDLCQLVQPLISTVQPVTRKLLDEHGVREKFGVAPDKVVDYLMLIGDKSDNIPGVYKCGPVTARTLIEEHGTIERVIKNKNKLTPALCSNIEQVEHLFPTTRKIITLDTEVPIKATSFRCLLENRTVNHRRFDDLCKEYGVYPTIQSRLEKAFL